ncbi:Site-specific DNA recombinase [Sporobacter termitidis DSM 10068]|uniref:Site-specific DNA recombinase n=1 Tax=Sporobacter termitidis DSM 10068 TaxID=1123282 RepID=A0A1M5TFU9_9FIRM|nr:recombinase family protein [Sporobacter termitidis]SHH49586.1 Site-specific DNA recombinase [Sporobacter termitidis DSM 10068]
MRVAAYCRVSTDLRDQINSFESQKLFFQQYIESRPDWTMAEIYADEGITGTTTADRTDFLRMIDDARAGRLDLLLTKEVSRFSRNILDAVSYTRLLKSFGVAVVFLSDGISTLDPDAELRLGIMASVAQEESRKTSERVKWGQRRKMERGVVFGRSLLGYDVRGGTISVEPKGAETVQAIFDMYVREGLGARGIADTLTRRGAETGSGGAVWSGAAVLKILKNEKYCGDLKQRKTITPDYLTHKKTVNRDENDMIYIQDHHDAIIDRETWEKAQAELRRRSSGGKASAHGSRYALSGKVVCLGCGAVYLCRTRKRRDGMPYRVWVPTCLCFGKRRQVGEDLIVGGVRRFIIGQRSDRLLYGFAQILRRTLGNHDGALASIGTEIAVLEKKTFRLADAYIAGDIGREAYLELKDAYGANLTKLKARRLELAAAQDRDAAGECAGIAGGLADGRGDDGFYLELVERAGVRPGGGMDIRLKELPGTIRAVFT